MLPPSFRDTELQPVLDAVLRRFGGLESLRGSFPAVVSNAVDFVLDSVRTARTLISELDSVEKTIIGLKVEHFVRDWLEVPTGLRDLSIDGHDVDVKNTIRGTWMIPPETYLEIREGETEIGGTCLLIRINEKTDKCWLGMLRIRDEYLNAPNRDKKRSVNTRGKKNIFWLVEGVPYQAGHWRQIDMKRFRELRGMYGGNNRVVAFFEENLGKSIHRNVILALLHDQLDPMKRLRGNGGAKDRLWERDIVLLSGTYFREFAARLGATGLASDQVVAFRLSADQREMAKSMGYLEADTPSLLPVENSD